MQGHQADSPERMHRLRLSLPGFHRTPFQGRQTHLDEDLGPVLVLLVRGHEEVTGQHGHQAVPLGLEVDGGVPPQEAAQSLQWTARVAREARERDSDTGQRTIRLCSSLPRTEEGDAQPSPR